MMDTNNIKKEIISCKKCSEMFICAKCGKPLVHRKDRRKLKTLNIFKERRLSKKERRLICRPQSMCGISPHYFLAGKKDEEDKYYCISCWDKNGLMKLL